MMNLNELNLKDENKSYSNYMISELLKKVQSQSDITEIIKVYAEKDVFEQITSSPDILYHTLSAINSGMFPMMDNLMSFINIFPDYEDIIIEKLITEPHFCTPDSRNFFYFDIVNNLSWGKEYTDCIMKYTKNFELNWDLCNAITTENKANEDIENFKNFKLVDGFANKNNEVCLQKVHNNISYTIYFDHQFKGGEISLEDLKNINISENFSIDELKPFLPEIISVISKKANSNQKTAKQQLDAISEKILEIKKGSQFNEVAIFDSDFCFSVFLEKTMNNMDSSKQLYLNLCELQAAVLIHMVMLDVSSSAHTKLINRIIEMNCDVLEIFSKFIKPMQQDWDKGMPINRLNNLCEDISLKIKSHAEIRKCARILGQDNNSSLFAVCSNEILLKIAGHTKDPNAHSQEKAEDIARNHFGKSNI